MGLGGAGGAADAVTAGVASQQDYHVTRIRALPANVLRRGRRNDCADFHTLGSVAGVINFIHNAGGKANLVAIAGIAGGGGGDDLALGQLAGDGLGNGLQGVCRASDPHGAVDVAAAGQRIPDGTADAGGRAAEGLDFRGVVVGLVLEQQQPGLRHAVHRHVDLHGAGVDLLGLVQLGKLSRGFQVFGGDGGKIHEADGLLLPV